MDFGKEGWRRLYARESAEHAMHPLFARGTRDYVLRHACQQTGVLIKNCASREDAFGRLARYFGVWDKEREDFFDYLELWIKDGYLSVRRRRGGVAIVITRFIEAQNARSKGAIRNAAWRQREKDKRDAKVEQKPLFSGAGDSVSRDDSTNVPGASPNTSRVSLFLSPIGSMEKERACAWLDDPGRVGLEHGQPHTWPSVSEVVAHYNTTWSKLVQPPHSGDIRIRTIVDRLAEGYTVDQLKAAISGARKDKFIEDKPRLQSLKKLLADADAIDTNTELLHQQAKGVPRVQPAVDSGYYDADRQAEAATDGPAERLPPDDPFSDSDEVAADG